MINGYQENQTQITILHFNDVYNVDEQSVEPVGGASRFVSALTSKRNQSTLTLFSGDCLGPSLLSTFTKGKHMIPVLNGCQVDCSVVGNHDFDYGLDGLNYLVNQSHFPWLLSNVSYRSGDQIAGTKVFHIIEISGKKFGFIGLVEFEWVSILSSVDSKRFKYNDYVSVARQLSNHLKYKEKVDFVIALTHMRNPNDIRLAESVGSIDLILGGHDHVCQSLNLNGVHLIKSGTDFKNFSKITITFSDSMETILDHEIVDVTRKYIPNELIRKQVDSFKANVDMHMDSIIGWTREPLDGRFTSIRHQETNLGNLIADIMCSTLRADCCIIHSGTFRSDQVHRPGLIRLRDIINILPTPGTMVLISVSGLQLYQALENGVSNWPHLEGRFPQVSGIQFSFDPEGRPGQRIDPQWIKVKGQKLNLTFNYSLATKLFLHKGNDGYCCLKSCPLLMSSDECPEMITAIRNYFQVACNPHPESRSPGHRLIKLRLVEPKIERRIQLIKGE